MKLAKKKVLVFSRKPSVKLYRDNQQVRGPKLIIGGDPSITSVTYRLKPSDRGHTMSAVVTFKLTGSSETFTVSSTTCRIP